MAARIAPRPMIPSPLPRAAPQVQPQNLGTCAGDRCEIQINLLGPTATLRARSGAMTAGSHLQGLHDEPIG